MRFPASLRFRRLALTALLAAAATPARAQEVDAPPTSAPATDGASPAPVRLTLDLAPVALSTGAMLLLSGVAAVEGGALLPPACRWCEPGRLDRWGREQLRWRHPGAASAASDALVVAVPAGAALALGWGARRAGASWREAGEDVLVATQAVALATLLTQVAKLSTARLRPDAWAAGGPPGDQGRVSFWSGHTALAFSAAAAATQVARLRGRPGWRWVALATFAGAAATGWLRVAGDRHWLTDVVTGAAVGTASGLLLPPLVLRPADGRAPALTVGPAPGGLAFSF